SNRDRGRNDGGSSIGCLDGSSSDIICSSNRRRLSVDLGLLVAFTGNVTSLAASVASLAGSVERATVGSSALARDVAELAASITLHGLSLAITSEVVGTTALVAGSRTRATRETTTEATTRTRSTATKTSSSTGSRASAL
ncbi:uncharacterized protein M437DRAFT_60492, partial [Aureobasidium melanogenum CBS 110374]